MQPLVADAGILEASTCVFPRNVHVWTIEGAKAAEALNGLVTNDVLKLAPGAGCYAAALTAKGKIVADMRILAREFGFDVITETRAADGWREMLRKYVNPRLATYREVPDVSTVTMAGELSADIAAAVFHIDTRELRALAPHHHVRVAEVAIIRDPRLGMESYDIVGIDLGRDRNAIQNGVAVFDDDEMWNALRIANGWPAWGVDMDESTLAPEANLDQLGAISFDKGCYIGQETVARVHFRGHVNRRLRRASFDASTAVPRGAELTDDAGKVIGDVRSSAILGDRGVAIVMARREAEPNSSVTATWNDQRAALTLLS